MQIQRQDFSNVSDWLTCLDHAHEQAKRTGWEFVIVLAAGIDQFGRDNDHAKAELYKLASDQLNIAESSLKTYVSALHKPSTQTAIEQGLTIGHAQAVLGLEHDLAVSVLTEAAEQRMSVERTRYTAWAKQANQVDLNSSPTATLGVKPIALAVEKVVDLINRLKWLTTVGAKPKLPFVSSDRHIALACYINVTVDAANWARADHVAKVWEEIKHRTARDPTAEERMLELERFYPDCTRKQLEKAGRTAEEWPVDERRQGYYIRYAHHEVLNMRSRAERTQYMDRVESEGLTAHQLENELKGRVER